MVEDNNLKLGDLLEKNIIKKSIKDNELVTFIPMESVSEDGRLLEQYVMRQSEVKKGLTYFEKNDVIVAKITPCFENGKGACLGELATNVGYGSTEFHVLRARKDAVPRYIYYHTHANNFRKKLEREMVGSAGQKRVPLNLILKYPLQVTHSTEEQYKIAKALSDIDNLIISVEKLINKKQKIKQGVMQELLTGKRRLTGFTEQWESYELGELLDYEQPTNYIVKSTEYAENGIPVLTAGKTFILGYTDEIDGIYMEGPVIIFDDFTTVSKYVDFQFKVKSSAMKILKLRKSEYNLKLIYEVMQMIDFSMSDHKRYWISEYSKIKIKLPKSLDEQNSIARILVDMDKDIKQLNKKLNKYKDIKQGMMQELLTGRIRLI